MIWVNRILALSLLGACLVLWPQTARFPGSGAEFPRLVLVVIAVLSVLMFIRSLVPAIATVGGGEGSKVPGKMIRPFGVFAATAVAVFLARYVGFFPAMGVLGIALLVILGVRRPASYVLAYAGLLVFIYLLFQLLLGVPLNSTGLWGG